MNVATFRNQILFTTTTTRMLKAGENFQLATCS
jgi:hypothetical protein